MGQEERLRKERRRKKLERLAKEDPERFRTEWNKVEDSKLKQINSYVRDKAVFTEKEYEVFLKKFPDVDSILGKSVKSNNGKVYIYIDRIYSQQEALGAAAYNEILKHVKFGTLRGRSAFDIVDEAKNILKECGKEAVELALNETEEVLGNEACRALAMAIGQREMYRMTSNYNKKE